MYKAGVFWKVKLYSSSKKLYGAVIAMQGYAERPGPKDNTDHRR